MLFLIAFHSTWVYCGEVVQRIPTINVLNINIKIAKYFESNFQFLQLKQICILHGHVFVIRLGMSFFYTVIHLSLMRMTNFISRLLECSCVLVIFSSKLSHGLQVDHISVENKIVMAH